MTSSAKAFLKYGPLTAGTLFCAVLGALGSRHAFPLLAGPVSKVFLIAVALGMAIQGAALFPRKWESRLIVKPHALGAGSLMLFAGSALILVLLLAGCTPATPKLKPHRTINFTAASGQELGPCSALDGPRSIAARLLSRKTQETNHLAGPQLQFCGLAGVKLQSVRCSKPRWRVCAGRIIRCPELAAIEKECNEI